MFTNFAFESGTSLERWMAGNHRAGLQGSERPMMYFFTNVNVYHWCYIYHTFTYIYGKCTYQYTNHGAGIWIPTFNTKIAPFVNIPAPWSILDSWPRSNSHKFLSEIYDIDLAKGLAPVYLAGTLVSLEGRELCRWENWKTDMAISL